MRPPTHTAAISGPITVPFPTERPDGYEWLPDEPVFDPQRDLQLTSPADTVNLTDLGYQPAEINGKATGFGVSGPFRVLSDAGAATMLQVARNLRPFARAAGNRIESSTRGGCYRSRWLRDLCISPELTTHLASIFQCPVAPHAMPLHLGHLNYEPSDINQAVDKWHYDTLPLDMVMTVTDPTQTPGGRFEYFVGTKAEAAELQAQGQRPPAERVVAPDLPGPGWAVALHGNMVVHRGGPLTRQAERITMVNGYVALDPTVDEQSRSADLIGVDDSHILFAEWAKFAAWRARERLDHLIDTLPFTDNADLVATRLEAALADATRAAIEMRGEARPAHHFE